MSKPDNNQKSAHAGQLKKEIGQGMHFLQNLTNSLAKIESSLVESDGIRATERRYAEQISKLQQEITDLQNRCRQQTDSFTDTTLKLSIQFETRRQKKEEEWESKLKDVQRREASQEQILQRELDLHKAEVLRLKDNENASRNQVEGKLRELKESCEKQENSLKGKLKVLEAQLLRLSGKHGDLAQELHEHQVMLQGRDMEISRLGKRLAALEAFSSASLDHIQSATSKLQSSLHDFCASCVESTSILPGWHTIPKDLHRSGLPRSYSTQSAAGRYVLTAAIQHSVWVAMVNIFESYGLQDSHGILRVAHALHRKDRSTEAVWRVLTANAILDDQELLEVLKNQLNAVADNLVASWELFQDEPERDEFRTGLAALLYDNSITWLSLLRLRKRISVSLQWDERLFETDSGEDVAQIPGDFVQHGAVPPILFMSPAFVEDNPDDRTSLLIPIQKGKVLLKNSPLLLMALKEEQEISSPRLAHKNTNSRTGKVPGS